MQKKKGIKYNHLQGNPHIKVPRFNEASGFYASKENSNKLSKVKAKNTKPEVKLRKALWARGIRYRLNSYKLLGRPDLIFTKKKVVVFVDGDFWHGFNWDKRKATLKTNKEYWIPKIERNIQRDTEISNKLEKQGWTVVRIWEHQINKDIEYCVDLLVERLNQNT